MTHSLHSDAYKNLPSELVGQLYNLQPAGLSKLLGSVLAAGARGGGMYELDVGVSLQRRQQLSRLPKAQTCGLMPSLRTCPFLSASSTHNWE